ncbi:MAG: exodeoxyribonuclease III [Flavobacteriales bacterium]|nr:exodeoxyribonuclease III [Flavobacteriales bacterium]
MSVNIVSWNVNGIRAIAKKGFEQQLEQLGADIICLQETKAQDDQVAEVIKDYGYHFYSNSAVKKGYSGTAILTKKAPISVTNDIGIEVHDQEGRVIAAEFDNFYLVTTYVPNSSSEMKRLPYRQTWDVDLLKHLKELEKTKPVVLCGDLNVAHQPMDLANPKPNYNKTSGYTQEEIDGFSRYLENGFIDTFREQHPDEVAYSWWSYRFQARARNIGWRLDYFLVSQSIMDNVKKSFILKDYEGSDHCPVGVVLDL